MQFTAERDAFGRMLCTVASGRNRATVTCANAEAASDALMAALDDTRREGCGECVWPEAVGEYRWMFRRNDDIVTLVALWSSGTLTGWQQLFEADTEFEPFAAMVEHRLASIV